MSVKNILFPTDFSDLAHHAASVARDYAIAHSATLWLLHVIEPQVTPGHESVTGPAADWRAEDEAEALERLRSYAHTEFGGCSIPLELAVRCGSPVDLIPQFVREHRIDLVVVGTHARGVLHRILFGSTSKLVMERSGCPVLMVPAPPDEIAPAAPRPAEQVA